MANINSQDFPSILPMGEVARKPHDRIFQVTDPKLLAQLNAGKDKLKTAEQDFYEALRTELGIEDLYNIPNFRTVFALTNDVAPEKGWVRIVKSSKDGTTEPYLVEGRQVFVPTDSEEGHEANNFIMQQDSILQQKAMQIGMEKTELLGMGQSPATHPLFDENINCVDEDWFIIVKNPDFVAYVPDTIMQEGIFSATRHTMANNVLYGLINRLGDAIEEISGADYEKIIVAYEKKKKYDEAADDFLKTLESRGAETPKP